MSYGNRGRRSYKKLMQEKIWGVYSEQEGGKLLGTCKAFDSAAAQDVFTRHNVRNPEWSIEGYLREVK